MENTVADLTINIISLFFLFFHFGGTLCNHGVMLMFDRQPSFNIPEVTDYVSTIQFISASL